MTEALHCVQRAYNIHIKVLPSDHPEVLQNINWIERIKEELITYRPNAVVKCKFSIFFAYLSNLYCF
jgi:hypothetical protein